MSLRPRLPQESAIYWGGVEGGWPPSPAPADALVAADDDTGRMVPEGEVRGAGANDIGGLERPVHRNPAGADGLVFRR